MNKEDLKKLGLTDEGVIDQIIVLHGKDIEGHKGKLTTAQAETEGLKSQLAEAGKTIDGFKGLDIEGVKKSADEWKAKAEQAAADSVTQMSALRFDHALDGALTGAKARNAKAVRALLQSDALKLQEDGSILGLSEQLTKIKSENDYLFESDTQTAKIVLGGNNHSVLSDSVVDAARKAAGLPGA